MVKPLTLWDKALSLARCLWQLCWQSRLEEEQIPCSVPGWSLAELLCAAQGDRGRVLLLHSPGCRVPSPTSFTSWAFLEANAAPALCLAFPIPGWPRATLAPLLETLSPRLLPCSLMAPLLCPCSSEGLGLGLNSWRALRTSQLPLCHTLLVAMGPAWLQPHPAVAGPFLRKPSSSAGGKQLAQRDSYRS